MNDEPPRIRDDRRDPDITRIKERLAILESSQDKLERLVQGMHYALFGLPEDRNNNGLIGEMHDIKDNQRVMNARLLAFVLAACATLATALVDVILRHA